MNKALEHYMDIHMKEYAKSRLIKSTLILLYKTKLLHQQPMKSIDEIKQYNQNIEHQVQEHFKNYDWKQDKNYQFNMKRSLEDIHQHGVKDNSFKNDMILYNKYQHPVHHFLN